MVGWHYYPRFIHDRTGITKRLLYRAFQILAIQYILILTINVPLYYVLYDKIRQTEPLSMFITKSMLFWNQIGLIHILPTFIPFFIISPAILYLIEKKYTPLVLGISISLFVIGNKHPYALDIGDQTIFPFMLWQIYFIAGCLLGIRAYVHGTLAPKNIDKYLLISILILLMAMFIKHAKVISPALTSKFPLNALGLLYGASLLFMTYTITLKYWHILKRVTICNSYIPLLGRYSLLTFVLHVYMVKGIVVINYFYRVNNYVNYVLVLVSIISIYIIINYYENLNKRNYPYLVLEKLFK